MSTPVFLTLALVCFYIGITLTFLNKEDPQDAPLTVIAGTPIQQAAR